MFNELGRTIKESIDLNINVNIIYIYSIVDVIMANQFLQPSINPPREQISIFVNDIISANAAQVVLPIVTKGTIRTISGSTSRIPAAGSVTYTTSIIRSGSSSPITGSVVTIPTVGVIAGQSVSATVSQAVSPGDSLVILVGGGNTGAGTGGVSFAIS